MDGEPDAVADSDGERDSVQGAESDTNHGLSDMDVENRSPLPGERLAGAPPCAQLPSEVAKKKRKKQTQKRNEATKSVSGVHIERVSVSDCKPTDFVIAVYEGKWWLGRVEEPDMEKEQTDEELNVNFMSPSGPEVTFHWPEVEEICLVPESCLLGRLKCHPDPQGLRSFRISSGAKNEAEELFVDFMEV